MKTFLASLLVAACATVAAAQDAQHGHPKQDSSARPAADSSGVLKRGEAIGDSQRVAFSDALKEPQKYADKAVVIEGVVRRVCKMEGCWVEIGPKADSDETVRVTFDHKFSVPKDADKMSFRAEGRLKVKTLSKETVEHLVKEDGAKIKTKPDGTADEVTFVATGVELWK